MSSSRREAALTQLHFLLPQRQMSHGTPPSRQMSHGTPPSTPDNPDSLQARQALDLFLLSASPEATAVVDRFLKTRVKGTLDDFLLNALHKGASGASGPFEVEWVAFATGAKNKFHSKSSENAWNQFKAFGGAEGARALQLKVDERTVAEEVTVEGVALLRGVLRPSVASELRSFVLSDRDACIALALKDPKLNGEYFSRVLSPRDASPSSPTTRWDKRLPWSEEVESAVKEILRGAIGETVSELCGGDDALLWECSAFISAQGSAPQIVHADTLFNPEAEVFTLLVALQEVQRHNGPTRFIPRTHHGLLGRSAHTSLSCDSGSVDSLSPGSSYCEDAESVVAILETGDATIYDSRTHHCGGPHYFCEDGDSKERVLFAISFRHVDAEKSTANEDIHGEGSILEELAGRKLQLGSLR
ncbi:hypothetical protein TrVE_jg8812 [Triparma verrucosa]|uniref:Uncharacterized protein n=1 Tax=Triparma verrucosa TaxID=1606542 RepID=A0A9W7FC46_9STRA|nr:hypothetical protein TrVE_jg8812 [Triparma verrucosa]